MLQKEYGKAINKLQDKVSVSDKYLDNNFWVIAYYFYLKLQNDKEMKAEMNIPLFK